MLGFDIRVTQGGIAGRAGIEGGRRHVTFAEAAASLRRYKQRQPQELLIGLDEVGQYLLRIIVSPPNMQQGGTARDPKTGQYLVKANPPPGPLKIRTGRLARSIRYAPPRRINADTTTLTFESELPYARIQEFGGRTGAHVIKPRRAKILRFGVSNAVVFSRLVHHPGSRIPARPYIRPGVQRGLPTAARMLERRLMRLSEREVG